MADLIVPEPVPPSGVTEERFIEEVPAVPATFREAGIFVLDGSPSMRELVQQQAESALTVTKAAAVNMATRDLITRFKASRKKENYSFGVVSFSSKVTHELAIRPVAEMDDNADYDPTRHGSDGTFIGSGVQPAGEMAREYLDDPSADLPSSVVILILTDGECFQPERTLAIADAVKSDPRIVIAGAFFATKGRASDGDVLLQQTCSDPTRFYKRVYDAETLRAFWESSMTAAAAQTGLGSAA